jgi:hypothetical protein
MNPLCCCGLEAAGQGCRPGLQDCKAVSAPFCQHGRVMKGGAHYNLSGATHTRSCAGGDMSVPVVERTADGRMKLPGFLWQLYAS